MSNPSAFLQACADGKVWVYCSECHAAKRLDMVETIDCIGNENYWGDEPWWHDTRVFKCCDCDNVQQSKLELQL